MNTAFIFLALTAGGVLSPLLIKMLPRGNPDTKSFLIVAASLALSFVFVLNPFFSSATPQAFQFLFFQFLLFFAFVSVSRMRQRKSQFLHALMSIPSNGQWFITMWILSDVYLANQYAKGVLGGMSFSGEFPALLVAAIVGALAGRMVGAQWMQWVEARWEVKTESVGSSALRALDAWTPKALFLSVALCVLAYVFFYPEFLRDALIVMALGLAQNGIYAINTRFANRNHPGWSAVTGLIGGVVYYVHWVYLVSYTTVGGFMPLVLLIPYTVATVAGSNLGATISMVCEKFLNLKADQHVYDKNAFEDVRWHHGLLWVAASLCLPYIVMSGDVLALFGIAPSTLVLPFALPGWLEGEWARPATLLFGGLMFFIQNVTHTLSSRAGNRNHASYHAVTCVFHGVLYFLTGSFVILNANFMDLVPLAIFGSAAGQLFAQRLSLKVERHLMSVMDVPAPAKA